MATLMSALLGCDTVDKKATEPITTQLAAKYGKSFTVYALGDRIDKDTATAYVYADDDPTMIFVARSTPRGELVFENYAYRSICRKAEDIVKSVFSEYGITTECFVNFSLENNETKTDTSVDEYIKDNSLKSIIVSIIATSNTNITGETLEKVYHDLYDRFSGINVGTGLCVLTAKDYTQISDSIKLGIQAFDTYRLKVLGAEDVVKEINIRVTDDGMSMSADEINAELSKEGN